MTTQIELGALREALLDAGASPDKASKAAEELAGYERHLSDMRSDLRVLKWMMGFNLAATIAILLKLFTIH